MNAGDRIAHYTVTAKIGAGGMGEVYRATDTKLGRDVALKVLPEAFAQDAQRMARFQREAQVLASLNHPNIAAIYGLEEGTGSVGASFSSPSPDSTPGLAPSGPANPEASGGPYKPIALAMELVEGPTLAERIAQGAIPIEEALPIAKQIAEALEYAHERGIIHRDLKPANIKLTADGNVKVLDFGLAKALSTESDTPDMSNSPTLSMAATKAGFILGTAAYMSPEQAKGKNVDRRTDVWAFGCVLFEMLTRKRAFQGEDVSETLAAVIRGEPDWAALPTRLPAAARTLLRRSLEKDTRQRLQAIGEARVALAEILLNPAENTADSEATPRPKANRSRLLAAGIAIGLLVGAAGLGLLQRAWRSDTLPASGPARFSVPLPSDAPFYVEMYPGLSLAISRDGSRMVYSSRGKARRLYLRQLNDLAVHPLAGTEGAADPFFSPDGEWIAFFTLDGSLKKVAVSGGAPVTLVRGMPNSFFCMGSWSDDGRIVFDTWNAGLRVISSGGGEVKTLTAPTDEWHQDPQILPGSNSLLSLTLRADSQRIEAMSLDGGPRKLVLENASHGRYLASGHLLFMREGGLMMAPFDTQRLEVTGPAVPVPLNVMMDTVKAYAPTPQLAVALNGTLAYAPASDTGAPSQLLWVDRSGRTEEFASIPVTQPVFQFSLDGGRLALASRVGPKARFQIFDVLTKTLTRVADEPQDLPMMPAWSPDGRRLFFTRYGTHKGAILSQELEGNTPPQILLEVAGTFIACPSVSADGRFLLYSVLQDAATGDDIWVLDLKALGKKDAARPFLVTNSNEDSAALSPDGRWVAYASDESGSGEVYVRRFPGGESKQRVSTEGGAGPKWSVDGRELFFQAEDGAKMMVAAVRTQPQFRAEQPRLLFQGAYLSSGPHGTAYAVSRDARRFLMVHVRENPVQANQLIVVQNWLAELKEKHLK